MSLSFLILSSTIRSSTYKTIKSVVGGMERLDVFSRCLLNLVRWNRRMDRDINLLIYMSHLEEQKVLIIPISDKIDSIQNEIDSTHILLDILSSPKEYNAEYNDKSFEQLLNDLAIDSAIFYLTPEGLFIDEQKEFLQTNHSLCFVLGSQHDLTEEQERQMSAVNYSPISLGDKNYLASHVITIVCNHLSYLNDT